MKSKVKNVIIRKMTPEDSMSILSIVAPVFNAGDTYTIDKNSTSVEMLNYWLGNGHHVYVLIEDDIILGTYFIVRNRGGGGSHVANCGFITSDKARGRGLAHQMLEHAEITASDMGFKAMQFNFVIETNKNAIHVWQSKDYEMWDGYLRLLIIQRADMLML